MYFKVSCHRIYSNNEIISEVRVREQAKLSIKCCLLIVSLLLSAWAQFTFVEFLVFQLVVRLVVANKTVSRSKKSIVILNLQLVVVTNKSAKAV